MVKHQKGGNGSQADDLARPIDLAANRHRELGIAQPDRDAKTADLPWRELSGPHPLSRPEPKVPHRLAHAGIGIRGQSED